MLWWTMRLTILALVAIMVGLITVAAMPAKLPSELVFLESLHAVAQDTPRHVQGCSGEDVYPSHTLVIDMAPKTFNDLLAQHLTAGWSKMPINDQPSIGGMLWRKAPMIQDSFGGIHGAFEVECLATTDGERVQITDYRKPYNRFVRWVVYLRGK
jgi:hypothetical protein